MVESFNKFMTSSEFIQVPPCPDFYHVDFFFFNGSNGDTKGVEYIIIQGVECIFFYF